MIFEQLFLVGFPSAPVPRGSSVRGGLVSSQSAERPTGSGEHSDR